jgi:regulator of protease activity HflC (stomatin/prohibitin superfamily)
MLVPAPHFESAHRFTRTLSIAGSACLLAAIVLAIVVAAGLMVAPGHMVGPAALGSIGASLLTAATVLLPSAVICHGRHRLLLALERERAPPDPNAARSPSPLSWGDPNLTSSQTGDISRHLAWVSGWPQAVLMALLALVAGAVVLTTWPGEPPQASSETLLLWSGLALAAAFPTLILERLFANTAPAALPESERLSRLLRVPLLALAGSGVATAVAAAGFGWALWLEWIIGAVVLVVAAEIFGRAVAAMFLPAPGIEAITAVADSSCAAWIRFGVPSFRELNAAARRQLGIDLSRSWAVIFLRRAAVPVAAGVLVAGWLTTAVTTLAIDERGIYERMGVAVAVLPPGLLVHLPWPFGGVQRVENGVVHDLAIVLASKDRAPSESADEIEPSVPAQSDPPPSADRLWDTPHPSEVTYLIASEDNGKQGFQAVDIDIRLVYRLGFSDAAALNAAYQVQAPEALVRAAASRLLARYFAAHTLSAVFREHRGAIAADVRSALQRQLDELSSGIELLQVVIEAIHPPPGAARAYHSVQAAEIGARTAIAREQGNAIRAANLAGQEGVSAIDRSQAVSAEVVEAARHDAALFHADVLSDQTSDRAFLFERWLDRLSHGLSRAQIVIVDHRLTGLDAPTIDLRTFAPPSTKSRERDQGTPR